jgi:hypothetical protein
MQFLLYEIFARIVAIYLCLVCINKLWDGLVERKIPYFSSDFVDWLLFSSDFVAWLLIGRSKRVAHRDATPVRYWIEIGITISLLVACLVVAIFGWRLPTT